MNFPADQFRDGTQATDEEVAAWFEEHKDDYRIPEKRKVKYALLDVQAIRDRITVSPQDVQRYYEDNAQQFSTPEQVRASHILLKTEGKNDDDVKKQAEALAAKAKGGATSRRSRRSTHRTRATPPRAATSTSSPAGRWCPSSTRWRSRCSPAR